MRGVLSLGPSKVLTSHQNVYKSLIYLDLQRSNVEEFFLGALADVQKEISQKRQVPVLRKLNDWKGKKLGENSKY